MSRGPAWRAPSADEEAAAALGWEPARGDRVYFMTQSGWRVRRVTDVMEPVGGVRLSARFKVEHGGGFLWVHRKDMRPCWDQP